MMVLFPIVCYFETFGSEQLWNKVISGDKELR